MQQPGGEAGPGGEDRVGSVLLCRGQGWRRPGVRGLGQGVGRLGEAALQPVTQCGAQVAQLGVARRSVAQAFGQIALRRRARRQRQAMNLTGRRQAVGAGSRRAEMLALQRGRQQ
jgi:hypothetical protein